MKETTNREQDRLLREAMERRAERVPALSVDFQERVMERLWSISVSPRREEGRGSRRRRWMPLAWVGNIAAAVVVGWFVFFRHDGLNGLNGPDEGTANDSALAQEAKVSQLPAPLRGGVRGGVGKGTAPTSSSAEGMMLTQQVSVSSPSLQGRAGGGPITEQALDADMSAFYASMEEIERSALREANTMTCEALGQACGATSPS